MIILNILYSELTRLTQIINNYKNNNSKYFIRRVNSVNSNDNSKYFILQVNTKYKLKIFDKIIFYKYLIQSIIK